MDAQQSDEPIQVFLGSFKKIKKIIKSRPNLRKKTILKIQNVDWDENECLSLTENLNSKKKSKTLAIFF